MKIDNDLINKQLLGFRKELSKREKKGYIFFRSSDKYLQINEKAVDLLGNNLHGTSVKYENRTIVFCFGTLMETVICPMLELRSICFALILKN